jgi:hypothetical protein
MRPGTFFLPALVALSAALAACGARGAATTAPTPAPAVASPTFAPGVKTIYEEIPADTRPQPYIAEGVSLSASESAEKNERLGYEMKVRYPQLDSPSTPRARGFNRLVRRSVERDVKDFKALCAGEAKGRNSLYTLKIDYDLMYATKDFVSVKVTTVSFTGYLNSDWFTDAFNYDLKAGRELELRDLFRPRSKYLEVIADYCVDELLRRGIGCGGATDERWLREGATPKADNYADWTLTAGGIEFTYAEYQVAPGCEGLVSVVVPYERLKEILKPDALPADAAAARP